jgi:uncharacterized protein (DUF1800 family)
MPRVSWKNDEFDISQIHERLRMQARAERERDSAKPPVIGRSRQEEVAMQNSIKSGPRRTLNDSGDTRHMLRRLTFASTAEMESSLRGMSVEDAFDSLVDVAKKAPHPAPPEFVRSIWTNSALLFTDMSQDQYQKMFSGQDEAARREIEQLRQWWLQQMIAGPAPLRENLVLFFHGTFGSTTGSVNMAQALHGLNDLLRHSCVGTIPAMLEQMVRDPSMMIQIGMDEYRQEMMRDPEFPNFRPAQLILNNWTVGQGEYTQADVEELCRALTGWVLVAPSGYEPKKTVDPKGFRSQRRTGLVPVFQAEHFVEGPKTILGIRDEFDARSAVLFLARHPATARRFSQLLIRYFGVEDSSKRLERHLVATYRATDGNILGLLREIVLSEEFWSPESRWQLIKSPVQLAVGACRQLGNTEPPLAGISSWLAATGQTLFQTPSFGDAGWTGQEAWVTPPDRIAVRYQLGLALAGRTPRLGIAVPAAPAATTPGRKVFGSSLDDAATAALLERLDPAPGIDPSVIERRISGLDREARINEAVRYIVATKQYQLA